VAATELARRLASALSRLAARLPRALGGLLGGIVATQAASAATLPEDRTELMYHRYDGGGVKASGPALLVRKSLADRVSLAGSYYVDAVSNASIDVVTTASPFKETRRAYDASVDWLTRDTLVSANLYASREPDYDVDTVGTDVAHEVFGGMTTVSLGFSRSHDEVRKKNEPGWHDTAVHWQYRSGLTQVLSPRWLASINAEADADAGFLGSPYRVARVFGAAVPERLPRTRSSRAVKLRTVYDFGDGQTRTAVRVEYRRFWDNWAIKADTTEIGAAHYFGSDETTRGRILFDASLRLYSQTKALFYSDNAQGETLYVTRNRQLGSFTSTGLLAKATWTPSGVFARHHVELSGSYERKQYRWRDFTDLRTGQPYAHGADVLQLLVSARF